MPAYEHSVRQEDWDDVDLVAAQLENEVPWKTCGMLLKHDSWREVAEAIKAMDEDAYGLLVAYAKLQSRISEHLRTEDVR